MVLVRRLHGALANNMMADLTSDGFMFCLWQVRRLQSHVQEERVGGDGHIARVG